MRKRRPISDFSGFSTISMDSGTELITPRSKMNHRKTLLLFCLCAGCGIGLGILIGWLAFGRIDDIGPEGTPDPEVEGDQLHDQNIQEILSSINKEDIRENLRHYTSRPRLSGTPGGDELVTILEQKWRQYGLDSVRVTPYDVLMSYPNVSIPNKVEIVVDGVTVFTSAPFEEALTPDGNNSEIVPPYNAFSPAGEVEGEHVYVNYGRIEDFLFLTKNLSIDVTGKIVIARYGKIYRGDKVKIAGRFNASGVILYTDPSDFNMPDTSATYPNSWWMPPTGVQRGTIGDDGDYLTPFYPSKEYAYRLDKEDAGLPEIPSHPIGYGDALEILSDMDGPECPPDWKGLLPVSYNIGPGFKNKTRKIKLTVNNFEKVTTVYNVIGYIQGALEPDRYVLLGNHYDAWVFGAIDPLSGTAALTETVRVYGQMLAKGHRPRRTVVFCAWGAEETGLIGSTEWVEEYMKVLYERAVAYLNMDYACDYVHHLMVGTSPLLQDAVYDAAKKVPNPESSSPHKTLYDAWKSATQGNGSEPSVYYSLGSGSDMATFYQRAGVPSIDMWYTYDDNKWPILSYPLYHSGYETFHMYTTYIDPSFNYTLAMTQLWATLAWDLADQSILPYDVRRYPPAIQHFITMLEEEFIDIWTENNLTIDALKSAVKNFTSMANSFHTQIPDVKKNDPLAVRILNDKLIQLERAFIDPEGLPGRRKYKHVMFAPSQYDSYSDNSFPGIVDTMFDIQHYGMDKWNVLRQQISVATYIIQSAANTLDTIGL